MDSATFDQQQSNLHKQARRLGERLQDYGQRARSLPLSDGSPVQESLEDLMAAVEELHATEEELLAQSAALNEAQSAIEWQRQRYQDLFEFAPDPYFVTDSQGRIREANRAASGLLGFARKYCIGKPLVAFVALESSQTFLTKLAALRTEATGKPKEWTLHLRPTRRQTAVDVVMRVSTMRDRKGALAGFRWLVRDVTERRQTERELSQLDAELDRRVYERTAQLEAGVRVNTALLAEEQRARIQAEQSLRALQQTVGDIAAEARRLLGLRANGEVMATPMLALIEQLAAVGEPAAAAPPALRLIATPENGTPNGGATITAGA